MRDIGRLSNRLARLSGDLATAGARAAAEAAVFARERAANLAPVDTGRLRDSISVRSFAGSAAVATDCPYALAVEAGSRRAPARPFLKPALEEARETFLSAALNHARGLCPLDPGQGT